VSPGYEIRVRVAKLKGNAALVEQYDQSLSLARTFRDNPERHPPVWAAGALYQSCDISKFEFKAVDLFLSFAGKISPVLRN
jgi:hypothetical protein